MNYAEQRTWRHDLCLKTASTATLLTLGRYNYVNETLSGTFQESFHNLSEIGVFRSEPTRTSGNFHGPDNRGSDNQGFTVLHTCSLQ